MRCAYSQVLACFGIDSNMQLVFDSPNDHLEIPLEDTPVIPVDLRPYTVSRTGRKRRMPHTLEDFLPTVQEGLPAHIPRIQTAASPSPSSHSNDNALHSPSDNFDTPDCFETEPDAFGIFRRYLSKPILLPSGCQHLSDVCDAPTLQSPPGHSETESTNVGSRWYHPFRNATTYRLLSWAHSGSRLKSNAEVGQLLKNVIFAPDFDREELRGLNVTREWNQVDNAGPSAAEDNPSDMFSARDGWIHTSVHIPLPKEKVSYTRETHCPTLEVPGVVHRSLLDIIINVCQDPKATTYEWHAFKLLWRRPLVADCEDPACVHIQNADGRCVEDTDTIRLITELQNSDAMLEEEIKIQALPPNPEDPPGTERAIVPLMAWSDSTHLAQFGAASAWPAYIYFGFHSKYMRSKPNSGCAHHLAYIPSVRLSEHRIYNFLLLIFLLSFLISFKMSIRSSMVRQRPRTSFASAKRSSCMRYGS